jgi:hypothetical protein
MSDGAPILTQTGWPPAKGGDVEALEARADAKEWLDRVAEESPAEALRLYLQPDAETALARLKAMQGDGAAYQYATIYTQWGNTSEAVK